MGLFTLSYSVVLWYFTPKDPPPPGEGRAEERPGHDATLVPRSLLRMRVSPRLPGVRLHRVGCSPTADAAVRRDHKGLRLGEGGEGQQRCEAVPRLHEYDRQMLQEYHRLRQQERLH